MIVVLDTLTHVYIILIPIHPQHVIILDISVQAVYGQKVRLLIKVQIGVNNSEGSNPEYNQLTLSDRRSVLVWPKKKAFT